MPFGTKTVAINRKYAQSYNVINKTNLYKGKVDKDNVNKTNSKIVIIFFVKLSTFR